MADEESNSASEDLSKNNPVTADTTNLDEPQDTACVETNFAGNGNPQISAKDKAKSNFNSKHYLTEWDWK